MPTYIYRREDGTTFEIRQKFSDDPLEVDPETGQKVHRVPQASGIVFKGSGFYVTDSNDASKAAVTKNGTNGASENGTSSDSNGTSETKNETTTETKSTSKSESMPAASSD